MRKKIYVTTRTSKILKELGENIRLARLRRNFSSALIAERAMITRPTLIKVEKGSPDVAIGIYAKVLNAIGGLDEDLRDVAKDDIVGRTYQDLNMKTPRRSRKR